MGNGHKTSSPSKLKYILSRGKNSCASTFAVLLLLLSPSMSTARRSTAERLSGHGTPLIRLDGSTRISECSAITSCHLTLFEKIDRTVLEGLRLCLIMRGAPGRGKTTMAQDIVTHSRRNGLYTAEMVASDDFMVDSKGKGLLPSLCLSLLRISKPYVHPRSTTYTQVITTGRRIWSLLPINYALTKSYVP